MRDFHVIYAAKSAAVEMESVQTQQERDRQTRLERRRQQERERRAREIPEERDRRRSLRNQRDRERRRVLRYVLLRLRSLSAYVHVRIHIYIRELAHDRPPMSSISLVIHIYIDRGDVECLHARPRASVSERTQRAPCLYVRSGPGWSHATRKRKAGLITSGMAVKIWLIANCGFKRVRIMWREKEGPEVA